ncbi:hypothetical protein V0R50_09110 [Pseudomonas sp. 148P]|uniref:Uncharacterized protein n=1 Tax=Pseudomonas ulcerans TaxID=3115852 RepID=A0ABU7HPC1_9PSED|nr:MULTISPECIES: hypothetical protein [unclassified Pseudomonas]MEE1920599.1 hypothetical protein [Pseudomonas sp. 147P]MEE1933381.1 hypothetical protein [Pseudomonas sp. 148P]
MSEFPAPSIPLMDEHNTIDLDEVGAALLTWVKYPGMALGDVVFPNWRGCAADQQAHDMAGFPIEVSEDSGYDPTLGLPVPIPMTVLGNLDQGWVLYSYSAALQGGAEGPESLRQFCYVGVRPQLAALLPVTQMRDSHDLTLDPDQIIGTSTAAVVPPYQAMRVDDKVTLTFAGYFDDGELDEKWTEHKILKVADLGKPLLWKVPKGQLTWIEDGHAEVGYRIDYASEQGSSQSPLQTFRIRAEETARLAAPWVEDHEAGEDLDPGHFPEGLVVRVEPWADMRDGDQLLLHWLSEREADSVVKALRIDPSMVDSGIVMLRIEPEWLLANVGSEVRLLYQYAREGLAQTGEALLLNIRLPLDLQPPVVEDATAEGGSGENKGVLLAVAALQGIHVDVPATVMLPPGARLEMHWDGHPAGGKHVTSTPVGGDGRRFHIPATAIAANIAADDSRRFEVFYRVLLADEPPLDSRPFNLRISPVDEGRYPPMQCVQAGGTTLSLARVPAEGADLTLDWWYFMAEGQLLTLEAKGVTPGAQPVTRVVRNAQPVSADEFAARSIDAKLDKAFLASLWIDQDFRLTARVSYDGGESQILFPDTSLKLTA